MKNKLFLMSIFLIVLTNTLQAQILLEPEVTGDVYYKYTYRFAYRADIPISATSVFTDFEAATPDISVGRNYYQFTSGNWSTFFFLERRSWTKHGVLEFNIDQTTGGNPFPLPGMTENNWVAQLEGIVVESGPVGVQLQVNLFNIEDGCEDGAVTDQDYDCGQNFIKTVFNSIPTAGTEIRSIDVTDQLRQDLFGPDSAGATSGFLFSIMHPGQDNVFAGLDHSQPRIAIYLDGTPTPAPTPTPQSTQPPVLSVDLILSQSIFHPGDRFLLTAQISNFGQDAYMDQPFVILLDVMGNWYWYPDWTEDFSFERVDLQPGTMESSIMDFNWPEGSGSSYGVKFIGALLEEDFSAIMGTWDSVEFGWNDLK